MSEKLFHDLKGVIPKNNATFEGTMVQSDTPFVAVGVYVHPGSHKAVLLCAVQGGQILSMYADAVRINLSEEMKKSLAEVILTS